MDTTKSFIKVHRFTAEAAEDFEFDFATFDEELLSQLVPNQDDWGELSWSIEFDEYEHDSTNNVLNLTLDTKWESPVQWLKAASLGTHYFENKLFTMTTIQKDETCVTGVAVMDGEVLQNKTIFSAPSEEIAKYYEEEDGYDLDDLDNQIWDSIEKFVNVCEQFYLEGGQSDD